MMNRTDYDAFLLTLETPREALKAVKAQLHGNCKYIYLAIYRHAAVLLSWSAGVDSSDIGYIAMGSAVEGLKAVQDSDELEVAIKHHAYKYYMKCFFETCTGHVADAFCELCEDEGFRAPIDADVLRDHRLFRILANSRGRVKQQGYRLVTTKPINLSRNSRITHITYV